MRVFYCHNIYEHPQTGGEVFYAEILSYLLARKDVELILPNETDLRFLNRSENCLGINRYFLKRFRKLPLNTIIIESEYFYLNFFLTNCLIKFKRPDLRVLTQVCQVPDVFFTNSKTKRIYLMMMFAFLRASDSVAVLSKSQIKLMVNLGALREKIHVVYIAGQRLKGIRQYYRKKAGDPLRIVCVAQIRPRKRQKVLVEALNRLRGVPFEATLVGGTKDREYEAEVRMLIEKYGLSSRVRLTGQLEGEDLFGAYAKSDIFILPSFHEPYGIVVQEAMSFGLPVVASNVDGIPEQVTDGVEGFLVPPGDVEAMTDALQKLIINAELREDMGQRARKRAGELPTWDEVCKRFYQALLAVDKQRRQRSSGRCGG